MTPPRPFLPLLLRGRPLAAQGHTAVCAPLVARDAPGLLAEAHALAAEGPDLLEWRVDFFEGIRRTADVVSLGGQLRAASGGLPLLFTRRSQREGGQPIALDEPAVLALTRAVCEAGAADFIDLEMAGDAQAIAALREVARARGIGLVLSFHDFQGTPPVEALVQRFVQAQALGADLAKVAVMPRDAGDVLALMQATWLASQQLAIPVAGMSMGGLGAVSRVAGAAFGSALSFGRGAAASAPGQWLIAELKQALAQLDRVGR